MTKEYTPMNWDHPNLLMIPIGLELSENVIGIIPIGRKEVDDKVWMTLGVQRVPEHLVGQIKRGDFIRGDTLTEFNNAETVSLIFTDTVALDSYITTALRLRLYMAEHEEDAKPSILDLLTEVRDACLYTDDDFTGMDGQPYTGITDQPTIDEKLFGAICDAINEVHPPKEPPAPDCTDCELPDPVCACEDAAAYDSLGNALDDCGATPALREQIDAISADHDAETKENGNG